MNEMRVLTLAMMSMSSVSGAIVGAYVQMIPGEPRFDSYSSKHN